MKSKLRGKEEKIVLYVYLSQDNYAYVKGLAAAHNRSMTYCVDEIVSCCQQDVTLSINKKIPKSLIKAQALIAAAKQKGLIDDD